MTPRRALPFAALTALLAACEGSSSPIPLDAADVSTVDRAVDDAAMDGAPDVGDAAVGGAVDVATDAPATDAVTADAVAADAASAFSLTSPAFVHQGTLPAEYTCDGVGHSPPLAWTGAPAGAVEFALMMTVLSRDGLKWNWVLYSIPASASSLATGSTSVGVAGLTSDGPALAYSPPCSRGPGPMMYTFTLHALSARPTLPARANQVTGAVLTEAIAAITLASTALTVTYTR